MKRTPTLTAGAIALGLLALPAIASAHTSAGAATCYGVTVSGAQYPQGGIVTTTTYIDDVQRSVLLTTMPNPGKQYPWNPATGDALEGKHSIRLVQSINAPDFNRGPRTVFSGTVDCPMAPPPPPVTTTTPTPPPPPPAPPVVTVPVYGTTAPAAQPPKPEPMGRKKLAKRKPVKVTCALLNSRRAGVLEYTRRGWYFRCKAPVSPRKGNPYTPPVTG